MPTIKYSDVRFRMRTTPREINLFVRELPEDKKDSLFEVVRELENAGLIELEGQLPPPDHC